MDTLHIASPAFSAHDEIPVKYSCKGQNINPPLVIGDLPQETVSLAIILEDPDAPFAVFDHWVVWNLDPQHDIPENLKAGVSGNNSKNQPGYTGPCPPSGTHRYMFIVYALDTRLDLPAGTGKKDLLDAIKDHILAGGELIGVFSSRKISA